MKIISLPTYKAEILLGLKEGYSGFVHQYEQVKEIIQNYCDAASVGVEVLRGDCIYSEGNEPCIRICFINYPRFPKSDEKVFSIAEALGLYLAKMLKQQRFTIVATNVTKMYDLSDKA